MTRSKILLLGIGLAFLRSVVSGQGYEPAGPRTWASPLLWQPPAAEPSRSLESKVAVASKEGEPVGVVTPLPLVTIAPCRQFDSRSSSPLLQGTTVDVTLTGAPCNIPANAQAVSVNVTVFHINGATGNGVVTIGIPGGSSIGFVNYPPTQSQIDNAGTLPIDGSGQVSVSVAQGGGSIDFILDVNGYYAPTATVTSLNGMAGDVAIVAGMDVTVVPSPQTLTIAANSTSVNAPNSLVRRDASGNFAAGAITVLFWATRSGLPTLSAERSRVRKARRSCRTRRRRIRQEQSSAATAPEASRSES